MRRRPRVSLKGDDWQIATIQKRAYISFYLVILPLKLPLPLSPNV